MKIHQSIFWVIASVIVFRPLSAQDKMVETIPRCATPVGVVAVEEPKSANWWQALGLGSPEAVIKVYIAESGCFTLVDRGRGLDRAREERELAGDTTRADIVRAEYSLIPDLVTSNQNARRRGFGSILGGVVSNALTGGLVTISRDTKTADVTLTLTSATSTQILAVLQGHAEKTNTSFDLFGGGIGGGLLGIGGIQGYADTEIGRLISLAYLQSFAKLVDQMGGVLVEPGETSSVGMKLVRAEKMYVAPSTSSEVIADLPEGTVLYPTGKKDGLMWEMKDDQGRTGWVRSISF